jgi:cell wall-associated NlpC family hydrolase
LALRSLFVATLLVGALSASADAQGQATTRKPLTAKKPFSALMQREVKPKAPFSSLANVSSVSSTQRDSIVEHANQLLGVRYRWAGTTPAKGLDCSGFVKYVFAKLGIDLPHQAAQLAKLGGSIDKDTASMQPGDLLVFGKGKRISHVGIYVGDGKMIHASSSNRRVVETSVMRYRAPGGLQWKGVRRVIAVDSTGGGDR